MTTSTKAVLAEVNEEFGEGTLIPASQLPQNREYRSSGSISVDIALGGGWSRGVIVDVVGRQAAGKTLMFDLAAVEAQRSEKKPSVIFDFEHAYDIRRFEMLGGDLSQLHVVRSENFADGKNMFVEWCADMLKMLLDSKKYACIGIDSTGAMVSKAEFDLKEEKGQEYVGVAYTARAMSDLLRQIVGTGLLARSGTTLFFMSQMRDNIGARVIRGMPIPDKRTGGRALPHYASVQIEVIRGETIKGNTPQEKQIEYGHETKVRVRKNKCNARQGRVAMFEVYTEGELKGLDRATELTRMAVVVGVIERRGKWYMLPNGDKLNGFDAAVEVVKNNVALFREMWERTVQLIEVTQPVMPAKEIDEE